MTIADPVSLGYRWPAEWEPHQATWLAWPHNAETWPGCLEAAQRQFAELVNSIAQFEPVRLLVGEGESLRTAERMLSGISNTQFHQIATNDAWIRDHGPTFLSADQIEREAAIIDWKFNAWGNKYAPFDRDDSVPRRIGELTGKRRFSADIVLEGGAIDGNGTGLLLTTDRCLLNPNRNPKLDRQQLESWLARWLGTKKVIWLAGEIPGDDTDGHIDQIARFIDRTTVILADRPEHPMAQQNQARLRQISEELQIELKTKTLPMPAARWNGSQRLPTSYINFYITNQAVIVPTFDDPADSVACECLQDSFPNRKIVPQAADILVAGLGAIHCLTQQEPVSNLP
ncbi:MAG: agmatine deiminase family protein [Pirellulaceae bacterium]|nr:agmatine deiminase family protein [Pirellulaceae bacterium]